MEAPPERFRASVTERSLKLCEVEIFNRVPKVDEGALPEVKPTSNLSWSYNMLYPNLTLCLFKEA